MFKNYFTIALRGILRNKLFSIINILGLSFGLAVCILIFLYTKDELTFDGFHSNKHQLYQLTCRLEGTEGESTLYGIGGRPHGPAFKEEIPEIKEIVRVNETGNITKKGNETFEETVTWVDDNFFQVFSFELLQGNASQVLKDPNSIVVTEETAKKYFGHSNVIGQKIEIGQMDVFEAYTITGIVKASPQNSSIKFKMLAPFQNFDKQNTDPGWFMISYPTFMIMNEQANLKTIAAKLNRVYQSRADVQKAKKEGLDVSFDWGLQPFLNMHLNTEVQNSPQRGNPLYSYILGFIALLILIIACINFINLTIAQSLKRSKEIGVRKVIGGGRKQLITQFMGETALISLISFLTGLLFTQLLLPYFNEFTNKALDLSYLLDLKLIGAFLGLYIITVFTAGFYPALILSKFDPVQTLYNKTQFNGRNYLSKSLIVVQFCLATFLIVSAIFMYQQFDYLNKKELGFNPKNVLLLSTGKNKDKELRELFKNELAAIPGVLQVAPRMAGDWITVSKANGKEIDVKYEHIDEDFLPTMQAKLVEGRNFSRQFPFDSVQSVLVNESFVKATGWKGSVVGKSVGYLNGRKTDLKIIGVVKNYHHESLKEAISPQIFTQQAHLPFGRFVVRLSDQNTAGTLRKIEAVYKKLIPYRPFKYEFMEETLQKEYETEAHWKKIVTFSATVTLFISCIGLFGLTLLSVQKRAKEIGIRKILGADIFEISGTISKQFMILVLLAFLIAIPLSLYVIQKWLQNFAYHIELNWQVFALALALVSVLAIVTLAYHTIKASIENPVKNLRTD